MHLIICEKQIAARRIAAILSKGSSNRSYYNRLPIYDIKYNNTNAKVVGLKGHVLNLDFPKEFNRWNKLDLKTLVKTDPIKKVQDRNIVTYLGKIAPEIDEVIIATDYDREGELIGVEGLDLIKESNPNVKIKRARFSALTGQEVSNAFRNLQEVDYNLSSAANSRQIIDLKWGAVLTRFISLASNQTGKDFLSVGRVQSPTLALIVDQDKEIESFKSKPYWQLKAKLEKEMQFIAKYIEDRFWKKDEAQRVFDKTNNVDKGIVTEVKIEEVNDYPPAPFNTTSFIRAATTLRLAAAQVMSIAEDLYTNGLISYPRTDNTVYPKSLSLRKILELFQKSSFSSEASEILSQKNLYPSAGKVTATDHPPIHPVGVTTQNELKPNHWKVYELIVRRFFATLAPRATAKTTEAEIQINSEPFKAKGYEYIDKGWIKYYPYFDSKVKDLPELVEGEEIKVIEVEMLEKETQPPKRHSQGSLIQEMDKLGLGTKSTRHEIIQKLYYRGYIENNVPVPTLKGSAVSLALENYATPITKPDMTATLEKDMDEIAKGNKFMDEVVKESEEMLENIINVLDENKVKIGNSIKEALHSQNVIGKCNKCSKDLVIRTSFRGKRFVGCSNYPRCKNSYPLPQNGKIISKDGTCKVCQSPVIVLLNSKRKKIQMCINMACESNNEYNNNKSKSKQQ